jgi:hypothetical protein
LLAEGTVTLTKKGGTIKFTNTSPELKNLFKRIGKEMGYKVKEKDQKNLVIYSTELTKKLIRLCKSFRIKPIRNGKKVIYSPAQFPPEIFKLTKNQVKELLRIYFSCEGGVTIGEDKRNDEVIVRVCHPILQKQVIKLIKKIGIRVRVRGQGLIFIRKRSEIEKFAREIGFVNKVKSVRGKHKGVEKNKLLEIVLNRHRSVQTARQANRVES